MTNTGDVFGGWIGGLADPDPSARKAAALRLYRAGAALCGGVLKEWLKDSEFRDLARPFCAEVNGELSPRYTVGIAVEPDRFEKIRVANGSPRLADVPPDQDAREFELHFPEGGNFDILTTRDPGGQGAISRYLQKFGEGIQQIELSVTNVDRGTEILRGQFSLAPIYPATRAGADGTRVNFFLVPTRSGGKVLIELVEAAAKD